jgi:hypothetical protein
MFTELDADTISDDAIRTLLRCARRSRNVAWIKRCGRALRHAASCDTAADAQRRHSARATCAQEVNLGAAAWLRSGDERDRLFAVLAGVTVAAPTAPAELPTRVRRERVEPRPLQCELCREVIESYQDRRLIQHRGRSVPMHLECAALIQEDAADATDPELDTYEALPYVDENDDV